MGPRDIAEELNDLARSGRLDSVDGGRELAFAAADAIRTIEARLAALEEAVLPREPDPEIGMA